MCVWCFGPTMFVSVNVVSSNPSHIVVILIFTFISGGQRVHQMISIFYMIKIIVTLWSQLPLNHSKFAIYTAVHLRLQFYEKVGTTIYFSTKYFQVQNRCSYYFCFWPESLCRSIINVEIRWQSSFYSTLSVFMCLEPE